MEEKTFIETRKNIMKNSFKRMNDAQLEAVFSTEGALLILAGAGSGKTTVLINRIACLIRYGKAYHSKIVPNSFTDEDLGYLSHAKMLDDADEATLNKIYSMCAVDACPPWRILAITFTNKAAGELKERLVKMLGDEGKDVNASTFHSFCAKVLRVEAGHLGYTSQFSIYDTDDSKRLMKDCMRSLNIAEKTMGHRAILSEISRAKDQLLRPKEYLEEAGYDSRKKIVAGCYELYQRRLKDADSMDFDDLICNTVLLFQQNREVAEKYQRRFKYIMIDEYQDTNHAQYQLVKVLAEAHGNLCVVGDDDQSIYKFRGATIENILNFEEEYSGCKTIKLEQNYRSTKTILDAANAVIEKNENRKGKKLWTDNAVGDKIQCHTLENEDEEGRFVAETISDGVVEGGKYGDFAVLYRANAQSNPIERALVKSGIPYRMIGGHRFFDRQEVRDAMGYLRVINNTDDTVAVRRVINNPKRGIGDTTLNYAAEIADGLGVSLYEVLAEAENYPTLSRAASRIKEFVKIIERLKELASDHEFSLASLYSTMLESTGYLEMWESKGEAELTRVENLKELQSSILDYEKNSTVDFPELFGFLEETALMTDIDNYDAFADTAVLMTMHASKGLEFPVVILPGFEDGVFPAMQSLFNPEEIEEDRRLCYVAFTRAEKKLYITNTESRMLYGSTTRNRASRFLLDVPDELTDRHVFVSDFWRSSSSAPERGQSFGKADSFPKKENKFSGGGISATSDRKPKQTVVSSWMVGENVAHKLFGTGEIVSVVTMGNDMLLEIKFKEGTKKLMANFARLKKL